MKLKQILNKITKKLDGSLEAEVLVGFALKKPKEWLISNPDFELTKRQLGKIDQLVDRRIDHEPIAYITNRKEFFSLIFKVNRTTLIPRPETELLVETALDLITNKRYSNIIELGAGSGCIAISIAKNCSAKLTATDICARALKVAQYNAEKHSVEDQVELIQSDLFTSPKLSQEYDLIIANLPYLDSKMDNLLDSSIVEGLKYEPRKALVGGSDGTLLYKKMFEQINKKGIGFKTILIEIGDRQANSIKNLANKYLGKIKISVTKDLADKDRLIKIDRSELI